MRSNCGTEVFPFLINKLIVTKNQLQLSFGAWLKFQICQYVSENLNSLTQEVYEAFNESRKKFLSLIWNLGYSSRFGRGWHFSRNFTTYPYYGGFDGWYFGCFLENLVGCVRRTIIVSVAIKLIIVLIMCLAQACVAVSLPLGRQDIGEWQELLSNKSFVATRCFDIAIRLVLDEGTHFWSTF